MVVVVQQSYGGVDFGVIRQGGDLPQPDRVVYASSRHIPYTNRDDFQFGGMGDWTLDIAAALLQMNGATLRLLQGMMDGVGRSLVYDGATYTEVKIKVGKPQRYIGVPDLFAASLQFQWPA